MECVICKGDAKFRRVKGFSVCRACTSEMKLARDQINSTRKTVFTKLNPMGEVAITSREVLTRRIVEDIQKSMQVTQVEEVKEVEVVNESI